MALTNATTLADYGAGIGTQGAALTVDATNKRVGVGTDAPAGPEGSLQVGTGITFFGNTGIVSAIGGRFSGDFNVAGALTFEDVTNIDSLGFGTFRSGLTVQGAGSTTTTLSVSGVSTFASNVSIADSIFHTGDTDTALRFPADDTVTVTTAGSERLRVTSGGNVNIGGNYTETSHPLNITDATKPSLCLHTGTTQRADFSATTGITSIRSYSNSPFTINIGGSGETEALRIDSSGRTLIGNTQDSAPFSWGLGLQVSGTGTNAGLSIRRDQDSSGGALLMFVKSRGSLNGNTVVQDGDQIGGMYFNAADGTDVNSYAAQIAAEIDGTPGSNDVPGRLTFLTTADGASSPTERLRIDSSGRLLVGTSSALTGSNSQYSFVQNIGNSFGSTTPGYMSLGRSEVVTSMANNDPVGRIFFTDNAAATFAYIEAAVDNNPGTNDYPGRLVFFTTSDGASSPTERLRIDSSGHIEIPAGSFDLRVGDDTDSNAGTQTISVGSVSSGSGGFQCFANPTNGQSYLQFGDGSASASQYRGYVGYKHADDALVLGAAAAEAARFDSSGRLLVGTTAGTSSPNAIQTGGGGTIISSSGSVSNNGTLDITVGTSNICYWSGFLFANNIDAANGLNKTQSTFSVFGDNQNQVFTVTQIATATGSSSRSFTVTYVDNGIIRFTNTSGSTCNVSMGFFGGGINMG